MYDKENLKQVAIGAGAVTAGALVGKKVFGYSEQPLIALGAIVGGALVASQADEETPYLSHLGTAIVAAGAAGFVSNPKTAEKFTFLKSYLGQPTTVNGLDGLGSGNIVYGPDGQMYMVEGAQGVGSPQFRQDEYGNMYQVEGVPMGEIDDLDDLDGMGELDDLDDLDGLGEASIEDLTGLNYADEDLDDLDGMGELDDLDELDGLGEIDDLDDLDGVEGLEGEENAILSMS